MREILFRGKKISDGEWIEGDLLRTTIDCVTYSFIFKDNYTYNKETGDVTANNRSLVEPATVGQYTGLKDKNGKRIFEGDLCLCDRNINDAFDKKVFEIKYDPVRGFYGDNFNEIDAYEFCMCEIIGNIHDNPELMGGGEDG